MDENVLYGIHIVHNLPVTDTLFVSVLLVVWSDTSAFHNGPITDCLIVFDWFGLSMTVGTWTRWPFAAMYGT